MPIHWAEESLRHTGDPHDAERADILSAVLRGRGQDVPLPETIPVVPQGEGTWGASIPEIAGVIHSYPEDQILSRKGIAEVAKVSQATVSKVTKAMIESMLLTEGKQHAIAPGRPIIELHKTPAFDEEVERNPEWRRAAQLRELMVKTGMDRGEIMDHALELCRQSLLGQIIERPSE
ncbi:MAG TPA: hypothetical protein VK978_05310 [Candidatus Saccharimonadales bacterium]|nr:hypothetical protein [Candidatus Saccharimonadales bacterium]